jgi:hypothetical protein
MLWIRDELSNNALIRLCVNKIPSTLRKHLAQRKEIGSKAVMKQVSKAIITQHNEYLLQLRDDHPGIFSTPINGHFSAGIWNSARPPGRLSSVNFSKNWNGARGRPISLSMEQSGLSFLYPFFRRFVRR